MATAGQTARHIPKKGEYGCSTWRETHMHRNQTKGKIGPQMFSFSLYVLADAYLLIFFSKSWCQMEKFI